MDGNRFDSLTRHLSARANRRLTLGVLTGAGLSGLLNAAEDVDAKKKRKKCKGNTKKCGKKCIPKSQCCGNCEGICCRGTCVDRICSCRGLGQAGCSGDCVCALSLKDDVVCTGALTTQPCDDNDDCLPHAVCRQTAGGNFCAEPCRG